MSGKIVAALNQAQAADLAGLTVQGVQSLVKSADPPPKGANGYPPKEYGEWLKRRHLKGVGVDAEGQRYDYETERARLTKEQADRTALEKIKTRLETMELQGEMVLVEVISAEWARMLGAMRQRLLAIPTKSAPRVRGAASDVQAAALIEAEIIEALGELSDDGLDSRTRARRERGAASDKAATAPDSKRVGRHRKTPVA
jgi:phage terminase Nu1 subunit (DNA packaging protein)